MNLYDELVDRLDALRDADSLGARWDVEDDLRNLAERFRGAVVLSPTGDDAQRLAKAIGGEQGYRHCLPGSTEHARAVLDRLAAGTEGSSDG